MPGHARAPASGSGCRITHHARRVCLLWLRRLVRDEVGDGRKLARLAELAEREPLAVQLFFYETEHVVADAKRGELRAQRDGTDIEPDTPRDLREGRHPGRGLKANASDLERDVALRTSERFVDQVSDRLRRRADD